MNKNITQGIGIFSVRLLGDWAPQNWNVKLPTDESDLTIFNLEGAFSSDISEEFPLKAGPRLENTSLPVFKSLSLAVLANNHFMDLGLEGAEKTIRLLKEQQIGFVGFGNNEHESRKPWIQKIGDFKVGVIACTEEQFGYSTLTKPGVASEGPWLYSAINNLRTQVDLLILSIHGGNEDIPIPSPARQDRYRAYVDAGVDVIQSHHSHVPQAIEEYKNSLITYGLGNFAVPLSSKTNKDNYWSWEVIIIFNNGTIRWEINPLQISGNEGGKEIHISRVRSKYSSEYLKRINSIISDRESLAKQWSNYASQLFKSYGEQYIGWNAESLSTKKIFIQILKQSKHWIKFLFSSKQRRKALLLDSNLKRRHLLTCNSHAEMLVAGLDQSRENNL